ncbi:MAG: TonB-dependent receptor [Myxococcales bacterium]|jgi:outer membrane receptor protein involved in Fe transport
MINDKTQQTSLLLALLVAMGLGSTAYAQESDEAETDDPFGDEADAFPDEEAPAEPEPEPVEAEAEASGTFSAGGAADTAGEGAVFSDADLAPEAAAEDATFSDEGGEDIAVGGDVEEIVVTGSRVKRTTYSLPSSVQVISREDLEMSGADNMADVVKYLAINSGSNFNSNVSTAAAGTAQFNLRGLGLNSTLVLLNGRRLVQSAAVSTNGNNFVDVNSIPLQMVERIEVLKGGASAIYGSDAVAGVINIITRKNMNGFEAQVGGLTTDDFDQDEWDVSLSAGAQGERTRVNGTVMYFERNPLAAKDRQFTQDAVDGGKGNLSNIGQPALYVVPARPLQFYRDANCGMGPNSVADPAAGSPALGLQLNADGSIPMPGQEPTTFANGGRLYSGTTDGTEDGDLRLPPYCKFNFNPFFDLVPKEQRTNTYLTVDHDVSDHTQVFFEAGYARNRTERGLSPSFPVLQNLIIPADHQYNPTGSPLIWRGRPLGAEAGRQTQSYESDTLHTVAGIGGDFGDLASGSIVEDWDWEISGTWSVNQFDYKLPDALTQPLQDGLNSCGPADDPADCFNPFYMSGAPNSQQIIDRVTGELTVKANTQLTTAGASLAGPLFELPGGDFSFAVGAQMRHESAEADADHDANQGNYVFLIGGPDFGAERQIMAGYGELVMPFLDGLEIQAAGRFEDYEDVGSTFNPKIGLSWTPAQTILGDQAAQASKIRLRGTYATSFRAPSLLQTDGAQTELAQIFDVRPDPMTMAPVRATSATFRAVTTSGNPDLKPETSTAITAGFEYSPVDGLTLDADYWMYNYEDIIVKESPQAILANDFMCGVPEDARPAGCSPDVRRNPAGEALGIDAEFVNAQTLDASGIDFNAVYRSDFGADMGTFSFGAGGAYVLTFEIPQSAAGADYVNSPDADCDGDTCDVAGKRNFSNFAVPMPRLRGNVPLGWSMDGHAANFTLRVIGSYKDDANLDPMTQAMPDIDAFITADLQYSLRLDYDDYYSTTFKLGINNLFDLDPPAVADNFGYDPLTHDPRGRLLYARLIQKF